MLLLHLHEHFDVNHVHLQNLEFGTEEDQNACWHAVYQHDENKNIFTFPTTAGLELKCELIQEACDHFQIPIPIVVQERIDKV